jgi:hypothetical protein
MVVSQKATTDFAALESSDVIAIIRIQRRRGFAEMVFVGGQGQKDNILRYFDLSGAVGLG